MSELALDLAGCGRSHASNHRVPEEDPPPCAGQPPTPSKSTTIPPVSALPGPPLSKSVIAYLRRQPEKIRPSIVEVLWLVRTVAPEATVDRRWGRLVCQLRYHRLCSIDPALRKKSVYVKFDPDGVYPDPEELLLEHGWIGGCYLDLIPGEAVPRATILGCLRVEVRTARRKR